MASVGPVGKHVHFQVKTNLKVGKTRFYLILCAIPKEFMDDCYNLINSVSWSRGANRHVFKFKRAPKKDKSDFIDFCVIQDFKIYFTKNFHGRLLRPY
ncbi:hypothetical protein H5410_056092 [Solanum commersonii]|uniref:Uncharacterized protein n=1 Tax=Solanum commersonii TaxID=4109 RepID=A0A9J5WM41_SOLCO|nr:hypothetical protein H5410_056092 [Solanum commersonii]